MSFLFASLLSVSAALNQNPVALRYRCAAWLGTPAPAASVEAWVRAPGGLTAPSKRSAVARARARVRELILGWPTSVTLTSDQATARALREAHRRLGVVREDLASLSPRRVALNQELVGEAEIRRHLSEVAARADEFARAHVEPDLPPRPAFRVGRFAKDLLQGGLYGGLASLFFVTGVEQTFSARWVSVVFTLATAYVISDRAQGFVTNLYLNLVNGACGGSARVTRDAARVARDEGAHAARLLRLLDAGGERAFAYHAFELPLPLASLEADALKVRAAPTAAEVAAGLSRRGLRSPWPADARLLVFDQILYFDVTRAQSVLLTFARERAEPRAEAFK